MKSNACSGWLVLLLLCTIVWNGCAKGKTARLGTASLIGPDPRACACCGGFYIRIDGDSNVNDSHGYYHMWHWPSSFRLDTATKYPVRVELLWTFVTVPCAGKLVNALRMERIE